MGAVTRLGVGCMIASGILFLVGAPYGILHTDAILGRVLGPTAINLVFAAINCAAPLIGTSSPQWLVNIPLLQFFGKISYGLYLFHMLAFG